VPRSDLTETTQIHNVGLFRRKKKKGVGARLAETGKGTDLDDAEFSFNLKEIQDRYGFSPSEVTYVKHDLGNGITETEFFSFTSYEEIIPGSNSIQVAAFTNTRLGTALNAPTEELKKKDKKQISKARELMIEREVKERKVTGITEIERLFITGVLQLCKTMAEKYGVDESEISYKIKETAHGTKTDIFINNEELNRQLKEKLDILFPASEQDLEEEIDVSAWFCGVCKKLKLDHTDEGWTKCLQEQVLRDQNDDHGHY